MPINLGPGIIAEYRPRDSIYKVKLEWHLAEGFYYFVSLRLEISSGADGKAGEVYSFLSREDIRTNKFEIGSEVMTPQGFY